MKKIVITFGIISGVVSAVMVTITTYLCNRGIITFDNGEVIGYTAIFLSFLLVFFGIRSYRDNVGGGHVTFGRALAVGVLIALISSLFYVASWEIIYFNDLMPGFMEKWTAHAVDEMRQKGASAAEIEAKRQEMAAFQKMYDNPLLNALMTLVEPLPVGLITALLSAAILRRKRPLIPAMA